MCDANNPTFINDRPIYGWAMNITTSSQPYVTMTDIIGGPSSPMVRAQFQKECHSQQRDGKYSSSPPFYHLGPQPHVNCPYYNYILPNTYPYDSYQTVPTPDPRLYWYYPYYEDTSFWKDPIIRVPKPG